MLPPHHKDTVLRDRYKLTSVVGHGGMGCVYRAEDLRLPGRLCAVKEIQLDLNVSAEDRAQTHDQFLREASILAQLDHPNLPKVSDFFTGDEDGREYLVMDYVPGKDLKQLIDGSIQQGELLSQDDILGWAEQILAALTYLHGQKSPILHRDIKPANIKLTPDNRIKLVDFGLVKLLASDDLRTLTVMQGRGTALYTPLEQYGGDGGHTDVRSDIYSLGATFYHLMTCKAPPEAKARFLNPNLLRDLHELNPTVERKVSDVVLWAMAMHPDDRPESVEVLAQVLLGSRALPEMGGNSAESPILNAIIANQFILTLLFLLFIIAFFATVL